MAGAGSLEENNFKIPSVFGNSADYKTAPQDFPSETPVNSVKASWLNGFPAKTFEPNNAPSGADFNGLFSLITGLLMNTQMGQMINTYDATYQGNIGGYPNGAIIWFVPNGDWSNRMLFQSTADRNTEVPYNITTQTIGNGWKKLLPISVVDAIAPDYSNKINISGITVPETGYVFGQSGWLILSYAGTYGSYWGINDNSPLITAWARGRDYSSTITLSCMVSEGDVIYKFNSNGQPYATTFPGYSYSEGTGAYIIPFKGQ